MIKIVKKDSDELMKRKLDITKEVMKNELADIKRRWRGFIDPVEKKLADLEARLNEIK